MDKAVREVGMPDSDFIWLDRLGGSPVRFMDYWTSFSKSGVSGDPLLATAEKGKIMFDAVVDGFLRLVKEFKARQRAERTDWHKEHWEPHT